MSFNFNGPSFRPMIQESQSMQNNGGGGNTGYFQRGKKKKNKDINVFGGEDEKDAFIPSSSEAEVLDEDGILDKLAQKAKGFVKKIKDNTSNSSNGVNPFKEEDDDE